VPVRHDEAASVVRRRRKVVAATSVLGAGLLGVGLSAEPGSKKFYATTMGVAGIWTAGGIASGPLHLGWVQLQDRTIRRPVVTPIATGVGAFGFFYACAQVAKRIPPLSRAISSVLQFADEGDDTLVLITTLANGAAEEVFFRGAVYAAWEDYPVARTAAGYVLATLPTRNPALVLAAGVMGTLWSLQRRASSGVQAPMLTHLTWSTLMLKFLPPVFREAPPAGKDVRAV
jgi:membrane protease YdiL (CAAX protease family)